jgi:hypothetical protein
MEVKFVEDPKLNEKVVEVIEELKREIVGRFHPKSIIITGSFGRGEAKVVEEEGKLKFLSDCEVILIPYKWIFDRRRLDEFERDFYERTGLKVEIWGFTPTLYLCVPFLNKKMKPIISNYELKYGSKVIYGEDYLKRIPSFGPEDIPVWEGVRLLLNRMAEALEHFSVNGSREMAFWCDKIVLACQDALLLTIGKFAPSYRERNEVFVKSLEHFDLPCAQELVELVTEATKRRLGQDETPHEVLKYWFRVSEVCDEVLRYVMRKGYGMEFNDYLDFQEKYMKSGLKNYTTLPFDNSLLQNLFRFLKAKIATKQKLPTLKMLLRARTKWDHLLYSHIPLVYFGIQENLRVRAMYIDKVTKFLKDFGFKVKVEAGDYSVKDWINIKDSFVRCWYQLRL